MINHEIIRKRTVEEDTLLGSRTIAFLIGNGFVLTALSSSTVTTISYDWVISIFGLMLSIVWLLTVFQSYLVIQALHRSRYYINGIDEIFNITSSATFWKAGYLTTLLGPTALIAIWLPSIVILLWIFINAIRLNTHFGLLTLII